MALSERLWRVNSEYLKRLSQAQKCVLLLGQTIYDQWRHDENQPHVVVALTYILEQVEVYQQDHRSWRYTYYYQPGDSKRMVQSAREVGKALAQFDRMFNRHQTQFIELQGILYELPRPESELTHVPNGDLWDMTIYAIDDLIGFTDFLYADEVPSE